MSSVLLGGLKERRHSCILERPLTSTQVRWVTGASGAPRRGQ